MMERTLRKIGKIIDSYKIGKLADIWQRVRDGYVEEGFGPRNQTMPDQIGQGTVIDRSTGVVFGDGVKVGYNCVILSKTTITGEKQTKSISEPVQIKDGVEVGSNTTILPGVTIGSNTTIGSNSVVTKDLPSNVVAVGQPAEVIKEKTGDT